VKKRKEGKVKSKTIALIIVVIIIVGAIYYLESQKAGSGRVQDDNGNVKLEDSIIGEDGYLKAPELVGIKGYINTDDNISIKGLRGKVVLIDFWTYTCINCIRTFPYLIAWDDKYRDSGLVIIGVHTPEFGFEEKIENVRNAVEKNGIVYPVVQDNDYLTWRAYGNRFWPRKYLIDGEGFIRYDHIGEGAYVETEMKIQELLAEIGSNVSDMETEVEGVDVRFTTTPELYAGFEFALSRGQDIGNEGGLVAGEIGDYSAPDEFVRDVIYIKGNWKSNADDLELIGDSGSIFLNYTAREVNIVADSLLGGAEMGIYIDGKFIRSVVVEKPELYNVVDGDYGQHLLELRISKGFNFNAFTFG
jgi:thiol-disulfide isomerase/thioredoxin